ncbi:MAG: hypothetical protein ABEJ87_01980 [Candidatus Nanohalobium sp.]
MTPRYDEPEDITPAEEVAGAVGTSTEYSSEMEIGEKDGQKYVIKDEEAGQGLVVPYIIVDAVAEETGLETGISYDPEAGKIIRPEVSGEIPEEYGLNLTTLIDKLRGNPIGPDEQDLYEASALKYFARDSNLEGGLKLTDEGVEAVDFKRAGNLGEHFYSSFLREMDDVFDHLNQDFSRRRFEETVGGLAEEADLEALGNRLEEGFEQYDSGTTERKQEAVIDRVLEGFREFR